METSVQNNDNRIEPMDWEEVEINYDSVEPMDWEDIETNDISLNMNDSVEPMDWESVDTVYPPCLSFDYHYNASEESITHSSMSSIGSIGNQMAAVNLLDSSVNTNYPEAQLNDVKPNW